MEKVVRSYRITEEVAELLEQLAHTDLRTLSGTLEKLIRDEHDRRQRQERDYEHG